MFFFDKNKATLRDSTLNWTIFTKSLFLNDNFKINWTNSRRNTTQNHNEKKYSTKVDVVTSFRYTFRYFVYIDLHFDTVSIQSNTSLTKLSSLVNNEVKVNSKFFTLIILVGGFCPPPIFFWIDFELLVIFPAMKHGDFS